MHPEILSVFEMDMGGFKIFFIVLDVDVTILILGSLKFSAMVRDREFVGTVIKRVDCIFVLWGPFLWWILCALFLA